ncbi:unnamed protein product [Paramecium sonneborni]|uniref:Uncharacterized protein n=1 Tax=Paramecium sonneborni TaxID=65129 RepID=A0A8S1Q9E9_9CILI|nr:unnamed protein product [Paramecium sonneborni]
MNKTNYSIIYQIIIFLHHLQIKNVIKIEQIVYIFMKKCCTQQQLNLHLLDQLFQIVWYNFQESTLQIQQIQNIFNQHLIQNKSLFYIHLLDLRVETQDYTIFNFRSYSNKSIIQEVI